MADTPEDDLPETPDSGEENGATERVVDEAKRVGERAPDEPPRSQTN